MKAMSLGESHYPACMQICYVRTCASRWALMRRCQHRCKRLCWASLAGWILDILSWSVPQ